MFPISPNALRWRFRCFDTRPFFGQSPDKSNCVKLGRGPAPFMSATILVPSEIALLARHASISAVVALALDWRPSKRTQPVCLERHSSSAAVLPIAAHSPAKRPLVLRFRSAHQLSRRRSASRGASGDVLARPGTMLPASMSVRRVTPARIVTGRDSLADHPFRDLPIAADGFQSRPARARGATARRAGNGNGKAVPVFSRRAEYARCQILARSRHRSPAPSSAS